MLGGIMLLVAGFHSALLSFLSLQAQTDLAGTQIRNRQVFRIGDNSDATIW
jgi:hypothetical protein